MNDKGEILGQKKLPSNGEVVKFLKKFDDTDSVCHACRYVFPLIGTNADVFRFRSNLLHRTVFLPPWVFNPLYPANRRHRIRLYFNGNWTLYSQGKYGKWRNIFGSIPSDKEFDDNLEAGIVLAEKMFSNLELPKVGQVIKEMTYIKGKKIREIFEQRSSFCMVFDR